MTERTTSVVILVLAFTLGVGSRSQAQGVDAGAPRIVVGSQVRIDLEGGQRLTGLVVDLGGESLGLSTNGSMVAVPRTAIRTIEIRTGQRRHTVRGAVIGTIAGVLGGAAQPLQEGGVCRPSVRYCTRSGAVAAGALGGALAGALVGSLVKTDVWSSATITLEGAVGPGRSSVGFSANIRLPSRLGGQ